MTQLISRILHTVLFVVLALVGMGMALIFMLSTAIAVAVLYVTARLRGQPFGVRSYWQQRQARRPGFTQNTGFGQAPTGPAAGSRRQGGFPGPSRRPADVIDVEARDVP
ncbi:putative exported protein [plant metagenome]|uniref:Putative exported protein n=1 Tax=plant metagenome TaxID=1297885 RepID=A0A484USS1_9ZZZZ